MSSQTDRPAREFALLFEAHPLPMLVFDRGSLALLEANDAAVQQYGWPREELLRLNLADIHRPEDRAAMYESTARPAVAVRSRGVWRHVTRSGEVLDVQVTVSDIEFAGHPARLALCRDVTAELRAQAAQEFLAEASATFTSSLDLDATLREVAALVVPTLADFCAIYLLEDGRVRQVAAVHRDPARTELLLEVGRRFSPEVARSGSIFARVARTGQPELRQVADPRAEMKPVGDLMARLEPVSYIVAPLIGRHGVIGVIAVAYAESGRRFTEPGLQLAAELGRRAGMAVENARLYQAAQEELEQRRRAEEGMREAEERYRALFDRSLDGVFVYGLNGGFVDANAAGLKLLGRTPEELRTLSVVQLFHPESYERAKVVLSQAANLDENRGYSEYVLRRGDGSLVTVEAKAIPLLRAGRPYAVLAIVRDVDERRRAEQAVSRLAEIVESSQEAIWSTDLRGTVTSWNAGARQALGYSPEEAIGRNFLFMVPEDRLEHAQELLRRASAGERVARDGYAYRKDGVRAQMRLTVAPTMDAAGRPTGVGFIGHDQTELVELERKLSQAQKMEAIGRLAGGVAHDFNNMLTGVKGHCAFLLDALAPGDPRRDEVAEVDRAADRAASLTRQLLAFGRRQVLQPRNLDLNAVVQEMESMLRRVLGEDVKLQGRLDRQIGLVRADPGQLQQVILNLAVNARDAMPNGGPLTITTEMRILGESAGPQLPPGRYVVLTVRDEGAGILPEVLPHIFEPFFTTKEDALGTGLGLATVYGIVTQSGGEVTVESEPARGSTFTVYLPEAAAPPAQPEPAPVQAADIGGDETILLVEDEHAVRDVAVRTLLAAGYRVIPAADGEEALRLASEFQGRIDLLVSDVVLPGIGGRAVAEGLTNVRPDTAVLYISGYAKDAVLRREAGDAAVNFLEKPFAPSDLRRKVREVLARIV